jgi:hypothetical protein
MNINELDTDEKSVMLARLVNWVLKFEQEAAATESHYSVWQQGNFVGVCRNGDLYDPQNMALAWRVLNWACANLKDTNTKGFWCGAQVELREFILYSEFETMEPGEAQRAWLDKTLSLAIDAGLIQIVTAVKEPK